MTYTIRPFTPQDYDEVWALHQKTIRENDGFAKNLSFHADFQNIGTVYDEFFVLRVHLSVSAPNQKAHQLYMDMDFIITRQERIEFGPDREVFDMTFMEKAL